VCVTVVRCVYPAEADQEEKIQNLLHKPTDTYIYSIDLQPQIITNSHNIVTMAALRLATV